MAESELGFNITALDKASKTFIKLGEQVDRLQARLDKLDRKDVGVDVNVNTKGAEAHLKAFEASLDRIDTRATRAVVGVTKLSSAVYSLGSAVPVVANLGLAMSNLAKGALLLPGALSLAGASVATLATGTHGLTDAFKAESKASDAVGKSAKQQKAAQAALNGELSKLAPSARDFVTQIHSLSDGFHKLRLDVQQKLFAGLGAAVSDIGHQYLPALTRGMDQVADAFNAATKNVAVFLSETQTINDIRSLFADTARAVGNVGKALRPVLEGLRDIGSVGAHYLANLTSKAKGVADSFAAWAKQARQSGRLKEDFEAFGSVLSNLGHIAVNVGSILSSVFHAAATTGAGLLNTLRDLTDQAAEFLRSAEGKSDLTKVFSTLKRITDGLRPGITAITHALWQAFQELAPVLPDIARSLGNILASLAPVIPMFARLARDVLPPLLHMLESMGPLLPAIAAGFIAMRLAFKGMVGLTGVVTKLRGIKSTLSGLGASSAAKALGTLGTAAFGLTGALGVAAGGGLIGALGGTAALLTAVFYSASKLAFGPYRSLTMSVVDNTKNIIKNANSYQQASQALQNQYSKAVTHADHVTRTFSSQASDLAQAQRALARGNVQTAQVMKTRFGTAVDTVAAKLGVGLTPALMAAKRAGIDLTVGFKGNSKAAQDNRDKLQQLATQMYLMNNPSARVAGDWKIINDKTQTMTSRLKAAKDAFSALNAVLADDQATSNYNTALDGLTRSLTQNGKTFDLNTAQGRANRAALLSLSQTAQQNYETRILQGRGTDVATKAMEQDRLKAYENMIQMGLTAGQAQALTDKYFKIPGEVNTTVGTPGMRQAQDQIAELQRQITNLKNKRLDITIFGSYNTPINVDGSGGHIATGGYVTGPGTGTSDSIPAWISNGEYVVKAASVKKYGPGMLNAINAGRFADGGLVNRNIDVATSTHGLSEIAPHVQSWFNAVARQFADSVRHEMVKALMNGASGPAQRYAASQLPRFGWGPAQMAALVALWNQESGWNPYAVNSSSGAYGIPQSLGHGHPYNLGDYVAQINWGLRYIAGRYGSPAGAWAHEQAFGWYRNGLSGAVFDRPTLIGVGEAGPERVDVTPIGREHGTQVTINVYAQPGQDGITLAREIKRAIEFDVQQVLA